MMKKSVFIKLTSALLAAVMLSNVSMGYSCFATRSFETSDISKIAPEVLEVMETSNDEIPVVIWNYTVPESTISKLVKDETGLSLADLDEEYSLPSQKLIDELNKAANDSPEKYLETLMKRHMDLTEEARKREKDKTDKYLESRKNCLSELYSDRNSKFVEEAGIEDSSIIYISKYLPVTACSLSREKIVDISLMDEVEEITLFSEFEQVDCSFPNTDMKDVMGVDHINQYLNLTGDDVKIGIYDRNAVLEMYNQYDLDMSKVHLITSNYAVTDHGTWCASVAAGDYGVAPDAEIYSATNYFDWFNFHWNGVNVSLPAFEALIDHGVYLINVSWGMECTGTSYNFWAKYTDELIAEYKTTVVCSTGNDYDETVLSPSSAYNCIAVNAFKKENNDYVLCRYSYDNQNGCLKPDIIADTFGSEGTSTATPVITGMIALLLQYKPSLTAHPELTKAILMASSHRKANKIYNENNTISNLDDPLTSGLSDRQGAGIPNMYTMISIASQHSYGSGVLETNEVNIPIVQPKYGAENMNISMAYIQTGLTSNQNMPFGYSDYDIQLSSGNTTKSSTKYNSSTEMIYTDLFSTNNTYNFKILKNSGNLYDLYGYAWSTDQAKFIPTPEEEGIYCLRNKYSGKYMSYDAANSRCIQNNYSGNTNQAWIMKYDSVTQKYIMQSGSGSAYGMKAGATISGNYKYVTEGNSTNFAAITIVVNDDGSYTFKQYMNGYEYALDTYSNYSAWAPYNQSSNSQKWYMESLQWRRGDVNMDGIINSTDANIVQQHINYTNPITVNINKFLADASLNHVIDTTDVVLINNSSC